MTAEFAPKGEETLKAEALQLLGVEAYEGNEATVDRVVARLKTEEDFKSSVHSQKKEHQAKSQKREEILKKLGYDPETGEKAQVNTVPESNPQPVQQPDVASTAFAVAMGIERDKLLATIPEDKRETVKEIYSALTAGKQVDATNIQTYFDTSLRAAGVEKKVDSFSRINSASGGAVPPRTFAGPTKEQIELAKKFGNDPSKVYGKEVDLSAMANPERFYQNDDVLN